jgi:hypothetical protein
MRLSDVVLRVPIAFAVLVACNAGDGGASGSGGADEDGSADDGTDASADGSADASADGSASADDSASADGTASDDANPDDDAGTSADDGPTDDGRTDDGADTGETDTGETGNPEAPGPVGDLRALPTDAAVFATWILPDDPDLAGVVVARRSGGPVEDHPIDGTVYAPGEMIGDAEVVFATDGTNAFDGPLTNGTTYHYRVWAYDLDHNYSVGAADDATPQDAMPASLDSHSVAAGGEIAGLAFRFDDDEQAHVAMRVDTGSAWELRYATCDGGCDEASDWTVTLVDTDLDRVPAIALDASGLPRISYDVNGHTAFARCDAGCDAPGNWSHVELADTTGGESLIDIDVDGRTWIAGGNELQLSWCDNGCTNAANWTTIDFAASAFYKHEFHSSTSGSRVLTASFYEASYSTRILRCDGTCEDPSDWVSETIGNTQGSVYPFWYRFTTDELGMRGLFPYAGSYFECEDCAPANGPPTYDFDTTDMYFGGYLELDAEEQPRIFAGLSTGGMQYMLCDYDCETGANWRMEDLVPNTATLQGFTIGSDGMPIAIGHAYFDPTAITLHRGVAP